MTPYTPGTRVVCPYPDARPFVGVVESVIDLSDWRDNHARVVVSDGNKTVCVGVEEVRPVMPRDRADLERWGRWWWRGDRPVLVERRDDGWMVWRDEPKRSWPVVAPSCDWRGPVAPPPEVRP